MGDGSASVDGGAIVGTLKVSGEPQSVDLGNGVVAMVKPLRRSAANAVMAAAGVGGNGDAGEMLLMCEYAFRAGVQSVSVHREDVKSVHGTPIKLKYENHPTIGKIITRDCYDDIMEAAGDSNETVAKGGTAALSWMQGKEQAEATAKN